tara:strand:+ start:1135 stop:2019 length:885 start_codon:yes stop_codon:yes gene_type:complete
MKKLLFPFFFFWSTLLFGQQLSLDTNAIRIGEQISLNITAEFELDENAIWPAFNDSIITGIEIIERENVDSFKTESKLTLSQNFIITAWDSGAYYITPIVFNEDKKTEGFVLNVQTIAIREDAAIKDIKANIDAPYGWSDIWPYLLGILIIGLLYLLLNKYIFNKKQKAKTIKPKAIIPADLVALNSLAALDKKELWQAGEIKEYHSRISEILRSYLENRFQILALELPTFDIIKNLENKGVNSDSLQLLSTLLQRADLAKFAKNKPIDVENIQSMKQSVIFVKNTKLKQESND